MNCERVLSTDYEVMLGGKIADVLCGGNVTPGTPVSE
jgi:hypothetical protein